jgi:hypothetical protein
MKYNTVITIVYIVLCLSIVSKAIPYTSVAPELADYNNTYQQMLKNYCKDTQYFNPLQKDINFGDIEDRVIIAKCGRSLIGFRVVVDRKHWERAEPNERFSTMMHELSHCYLGVDHSPDPGNFMYAYENYLPIDVVLIQLRDLLIDHCSSKE